MFLSCCLTLGLEQQGSNDEADDTGGGKRIRETPSCTRKAQRGKLG
jgi:hypothetical protein